MEQIATTDLPVSELASFAATLGGDVRRNVELLQQDLAGETDEGRRALIRWCLLYGALGLETFEAVVTLLEAGLTRGAFVLLRSLVEYHVRLRYYVRQAGEEGQSEALRDWDDTAARLAEVATPFQPDEWDDDVQTRIVEVLGALEAPGEADLLRRCAYLEEKEDEQNEYRWARSAWLMERAFGRGEPVAIADALAEDGAVAWRSASAAPRTLLFEAVWYLLGIVDTFALVRGWAYGAVKARQDAVRLYLADKPEGESRR